MRANLVVVVVPVMPKVASVANVLEVVLVEELVTDASVQALSECVFHGLSGPDEGVLNPVGVGPGIKHFAGEFRSVVGADSNWFYVSSHRLVQHARYLANWHSQVEFHSGAAA